MRNPWLDIPLADYEGHMGFPSIGQAEMLADQFDRLLAGYSPTSVAVIGCAGGNGLDRIDPNQVQRVVAVDVNPKYVEETGKRHAHRLKHLEMYCADVQSPSLHIAPVDLVYAALLFEYVDPASTLRTLKRSCRTGSVLATVLQLPNSTQQLVSPSPYTSLSVLAPAMTLIAPEHLIEFAVAAGFAPVGSETIASPSGKQFRVLVFRA